MLFSINHFKAITKPGTCLTKRIFAPGVSWVNALWESCLPSKPVMLTERGVG